MMVENLYDEIRECLRYAEEHARQAKEASRPNLREDFLEMGPVAAVGPRLPI